MLLPMQFKIVPRRPRRILVEASLQSFFFIVRGNQHHTPKLSSYPLEAYQKNLACIPMASADHEPNAVQVSKTTDGITTITISRKHRRNAVGQCQNHTERSSNMTLTLRAFCRNRWPNSPETIRSIHQLRKRSNTESLRLLRR